MKLHYYLMSMALMAGASVAFTACDDDDVVDEPVYVISPDDSEATDVTFTSDTIKVKIGAENRAALPIATADGDVKAFSLDPETAEVVDVNGTPMIEGFRNGFTGVMVSDANNHYKQLAVSVYTTDVMTLSHTEFNFETPLGASATSTEVSVTLGNGGYSVESDNSAVRATINSETGVITLRATSKVQPYTATVTVRDASNLSASLVVNVTASLAPFTPEQLQEILAITESTVWADCKDPSDGNVPYYYSYRRYGYGEWLNNVENGNQVIGWWMNQWGSDYGGISIEYPVGTQVNAPADGTLAFQYSNSAWYDRYTYPVKVTLLEDNETRTVAIACQVDEVNQRLNRGYVILYK